MMYGHPFGYGAVARGGLGVPWLMHLFGVMFWLALVAGIVVLIVAAVRSTKHGHGATIAATPAGVAGPLEGPPVAVPPTPAPRADPALEIARTRYATGELTKKQFDEIVKTLSQ